MKILMVVDDVLLRAALTKLLEANHYLIDLASDGQVGLELATNIEYDLILLDVQAPKLEGISLCQQLRAQGYCKPILLLIANDSDAIAVAGFEAGADDYIGKPYASEILLARIRTLLRRNNVFSPVKKASSILTWDKLCLDQESGRVTWAGQVIALTATEYHLLELFLRNPDRIFSRSVILDRLWGLDDAPTDRAINTYIKDLRKKLKAGGLPEDIIETIYGMGYRLKSIPKTPVLPTNATQHKPRRESKATMDVRSTKTQLLKRFREGLTERIAVLEQANISLEQGNLDMQLQQAARAQAHKLAGALGTFGYQKGSKLARSLEHLLQKDEFNLSEDGIRFSKLFGDLTQELSKKPSASSISSSIFSSAQTYRVLVIDDDAALREQLQAEAKDWGFSVKIAVNTAIARAMLTSAPPDVVLLDLSFPKSQGDGLMLLQEMRAQLPNLPIIIFTRRDSLSDRLAVSRLGAQQFLLKPATTTQIFQAIARVLAKPTRSEAKVLIVDDDLDILACLSTMLEPWGHL